MSKKAKSIERFVVEKWTRDKLQGAAYNPRVLDERGRRKLTKGIEKLGMLAPIIVNKRTGNIVGGHQRLSVMDAHYATPDYELQVSVVDLDEKQEKEANILLNNVEAQGQFDLDKLNDMLSEGLDLDASGFDAADVYRLFGDSAKVDASVAEAYADSVRESITLKKAIKEKISKDADFSTDFYTVAVFSSAAARDKFHELCGFDENRFQSGAELTELIAAPAAPAKAVRSKGSTSRASRSVA